MLVRPISVQDRAVYEASAPHPLQSYAWGEFRAKTGQFVERIGIFDNGKLVDSFQVTFHTVPHTSYTVGYIPRARLPTKDVFTSIAEIGHKYNALFIKLEPNVAVPAIQASELGSHDAFLRENGCVPGKSLFTPFTFQLPLTPTEEELLARMHQKTRYNIGLATRKGVTIVEDSTAQGLEDYIRLMEETTKRQQFYAHSPEYFRSMWETLKPSGMMHIFKAMYEGNVVSVWIVFVYNNVLYYPYGASSRENREVMANNLLAWEVIRFGKQSGCTLFDLWGSLGPDADPRDPWFGFHKFKEGYGGTLMQFVGTYDFVLQPALYGLFQKADNLRWSVLRARKKLGL